MKIFEFEFFADCKSDVVFIWDPQGSIVIHDFWN